LSWVAALVHTHRARLLAYARKRGLDAEAALDAVQDSFLSFLRLPEARDIARIEEDALKLLTVLLRHNLQNHRRKQARRAAAQNWAGSEIEPPESVSSEALVHAAEELARVEGCILRMNKLQQSVVWLSLLDEAPREEIAAQLGISEGYARVLLHRARAHLRTCSFTETPAS
jgi:RNA polymerase sigma-70 factor (ECF subfamily)